MDFRGFKRARRPASHPGRRVRRVNPRTRSNPSSMNSTPFSPPSGCARRRASPGARGAGAEDRPGRVLLGARVGVRGADGAPAREPLPQYEAHAGTTLSDGSRYDRFTDKLVAFLRACVRHATQHASGVTCPALKDLLMCFKDVVPFDNTVARWNAALVKLWPATRSREPSAGLGAYSRRPGDASQLKAHRVRFAKGLISGDHAAR